jgi:aminocarboxymuconate-semialdehyde decarboxylase
MRRLDIHNHVIPQSCLDRVRAEPAALQMRIEDHAGKPWMQHQQGYAYPLHSEFSDPTAKLARLTQAHLDGAVLSLAPPLLAYSLDPAVATPFLRRANEGIAAFCAADPARYRGVAAVPLQDVPASVRELEHAVGALGLVGVEIGTMVNGRALDDPSLEPFFASAEALQVPVLIHPAYVGTRPGLEAFYFTNVLGNPLETTMAAMRLIAGGVLDRHPKLVLCLAHGGGFLPYQLGRLRHAATVRPELRHMARSPLEYLNQFYFDSITHHPLALRFLIEWAGADRVMLGSDFPYDMGDPDPVRTFEDAIDGHREWEELISSGTAKRLFRFSS